MDLLMKSLLWDIYEIIQIFLNFMKFMKEIIIFISLRIVKR